ncbi:hypothetical protein BH10BAC2_BH10BAC2_43270 [soil metagenome]
MKINKKTILFLFVLIAVTTLVKVLCAPNINFSGFSAGIAVALFAGFTEKDSRKIILLPLLTLFISDVLIQLLYLADMFPFAGFYQNQWINYVLILGLSFIGVLFRKGGVLGMLSAAVIAPAIFYLISNYIVWATQSELLGYSNDLSGLMTSYRAGLPFYRNSVISTIIFLPSFVALYHWLMQGKLTLQTAK